MTFYDHHPRSDKRLYSSSEAASCLGISITHLYRLACSGQIASVRSGSVRLFRPADLDYWIAGHASNNGENMTDGAGDPPSAA
jgi:excisionase family DNA binding protein